MTTGMKFIIFCWFGSGEVIGVNETDDGAEIFRRVLAGVDGSGAVAVGDRVYKAGALAFLERRP